LTDDFKLVDAQGRTFNASAKANVALLQESRDKDFLISELQPGVTHQMMQGFEVPDSSLQSDLTVVIPKKGFWSSGEVRIGVRRVQPAVCRCGFVGYTVRLGFWSQGGLPARSWVFLGVKDGN
jgi:hypothetical protein